MLRSFSAGLLLGMACLPAFAQEEGPTDGLVIEVGNVDLFSPTDPAVVRALDATRYIGAVVCGRGFEQNAIKVMDNSNLFEWIWSTHHFSPRQLDFASTGAMGDLLSSVRCDAAKLPQVTQSHPILASKTSTWKMGRVAYKIRETEKAMNAAKDKLSYGNEAKRSEVLLHAARLLTASATFAIFHQLEEPPLSSIQAAPARAASSSLLQAQILAQLAAITIDSYAGKKTILDLK